MKTKIWAHRGSSHTYIENTMAAFKQAILDKADGVELDVQRSLDGQLVVIHDENLRRLAEVDEYIWNLGAKDLQELKLKPQFHYEHTEARQNETEEFQIPLLLDVLKLFQSTQITINIELKNSYYLYPGMEEEVIELVKLLEMQDQVIYSSFNHESVHRLSQLTGRAYCGLLTPEIMYQPWEYLQQVGAGAYHPMLNSLQQGNMFKEFRQRDIKIHVWTADDEAYINACLLAGVDAIITNEPLLALALRRQFTEDQGKSAMASVESLGIRF